MIVPKQSIVLLVVVFISSLSATTFADPTTLAPAHSAVSSGLSIVYDPDSGRVTATAPAGTELAALQLLSESSMFTSSCENLPGGFDLCKSDRVFKLVTTGFDQVDLGPILPKNIPGSILLEDLMIDGASLQGGFEVGSGPVLVHSDFALPEPSSALLLGTGLLLLGGSMRRRHARR